MKHNWIKREDGMPDEFAWESGFHNGVICKDCGKHICVCCHPDYMEMDDCTGPIPASPMTNADCIRAMSNEELAEVLSAPCLGCVVKNCRLHNYGSGGCTIAFLKWLQQPTEEENDD